MLLPTYHVMREKMPFASLLEALNGTVSISKIEPYNVQITTIKVVGERVKGSINVHNHRTSAEYCESGNLDIGPDNYAKYMHLELHKSLYNNMVSLAKSVSRATKGNSSPFIWEEGNSNFISGLTGRLRYEKSDVFVEFYSNIFGDRIAHFKTQL